MKKIIAVLTVLFVSLGFLTEVNAAMVYECDHNSVSNECLITPRVAMCQCGGTLNIVKTSYTPWVRTGVRRTCQHYPWGEDMQESSQITRTYRCSRCGVGHDSNSYQYRWVCYGHN